MELDEELLKDIEKAKKKIEEGNGWVYFRELYQAEKALYKRKKPTFLRTSIISFYCSESKYLTMTQEEINKDSWYKEAVTKVLEEDEFEQQLHKEVQQLHKIPLPFYIKINKRKNARYPGCYTRPGSCIEIGERYYKNRQTGEINYSSLREILLHEYAHYLHSYYTGFEDGGEHGWVFETFLFILYRLGYESGYCRDKGLDRDCLKNFQLQNPYFRPICEKMGYDYDQIMKPDYIVKTDHPNFHVHVY